MLASTTVPPLAPPERVRLAGQIGESAANAMTVHALLRGNCTAIRLDADGDWAALVELDYLPSEPMAYGTAPALLSSLLTMASGWACFVAEEEMARKVGAQRSAAGQHVRYLADLGYLLHKPAPKIEMAEVRLLTTADHDLVATSGRSLTRLDESLLAELLACGLAAGAIVDEKLVSLATVESPAGAYGEIGIATASDWRRRGFASAAAALVAHSLRMAGRIPVWSTGEDNFASQRAAARLGFEPAFRRLFVIPTGIT